MEFVQVDVFASKPFEGNPLAVFPDAARLQAEQMQAIAREMNLSETAFVTEFDSDSYRVRIFTPDEELAFAGHPTIGTTWVMRELGHLRSEHVTQYSKAGPTSLRIDGERIWFEREGRAEVDMDLHDIHFNEQLARGLGLSLEEIGLEARELGRSGHLRPSYSDAGLRHLMVPLASLDALGRARPAVDRLPKTDVGGVYCFTATQAGRVQARGFFPGLGIPEDPATGSAAACLGIYLADRIGDIELELAQGIEMGRPSKMFVQASKGRVAIGGEVHLVLRARLETLP